MFIHRPRPNKCFPGHMKQKDEVCHNDPKFSDRHVLANSVDPDQTAARSSFLGVSKFLGFFYGISGIIWATSGENLF